MCPVKESVHVRVQASVTFGGQPDCQADGIVPFHRRWSPVAGSVESITVMWSGAMLKGVKFRHSVSALKIGIAQSSGIVVLSL
jgi:hypothetical protein